MRVNKVTRIITALAASAALATIAAPALAADVDGDGYHDALVRERSQPMFGVSNVGAKCELVVGNRGRLTVRPPRAWGLATYGAQRLYWRPVFYDMRTNARVLTPQWRGPYAVGPHQYTDFGGGPNAPQTMIGYNNYWTGGLYDEHSMGDGVALYAFVQVGWQSASGQWTQVSLPINDMGTYAAGTLIPSRGGYC